MPKVKITSQGTKYVDIDELRKNSVVEETLRFAAETFHRLPGPREASEVPAMGGADPIPHRPAPPSRERVE